MVFIMGIIQTNFKGKAKETVKKMHPHVHLCLKFEHVYYIEMVRLLKAHAFALLFI